MLVHFENVTPVCMLVIEVFQSSIALTLFLHGRRQTFSDWEGEFRLSKICVMQKLPVHSRGVWGACPLGNI